MCAPGWMLLVQLHVDLPGAKVLIVDCSPSKRTGIFKISWCFNVFFLASLGLLSVKATSEFCSGEEGDANSRSAICGDAVSPQCLRTPQAPRVGKTFESAPARVCRDGNNSLESQEFCTRDPEPCPEGSQLCSSGSSSHVSPGMAPCSASIAVCHDP